MPTSIDSSVEAVRLGRIEVITGGMFAGKTEELIRRLIRAKIAKQNVLAFKANIDNRYDPVMLASHSGMTLMADTVPVTKEGVDEIRRIIEDHERTKGTVHVVGIDEVHFLHPSIVDLADELADRNIRVIIAGLDLDFSDEPFEAMKRLLAKAEFVDKLKAVCNQCGAEGTKTYLKAASVPDLKRIIVGGADLYESRCRRCFRKPSVKKE